MDEARAVRSNAGPEWGSDAIAETLQALDIPYLALNPGASFRGIHDSVVNYLANKWPELLLCIHEEAAVAIAHGYAKVTGKPLAVALHSNVGLMHGSMAIFNAWCDRVPMIVIGATGPLDAAKRRPWIDWIHTSQDQGSLIRDFIKWDDQPGSVTAARWSLLEGTSRAMTAPRGPVYINFDADIQEAPLSAPLPALDPARYSAPPSPAPDPAAVREAARILQTAGRVLVLMGRVSRHPSAWACRIKLVEALNARVATDFKAGAAFPSWHQANVGNAGYFPDEVTQEAIRTADAILSLDWIDLGGTLRAAFQGEFIPARVISASLDVHSHRGWNKEAGSPPPVDVHLLNEPDDVVAALVRELPTSGSVEQHRQRTRPAPTEGILTPQSLAAAIHTEVAGRNPCLIRAPLSWTGADWEMLDPLSFLGYDGGGGLGSGPGMAVGAALALRDTAPDRLPLAVLGDGDFLMNATALWTAANGRIPLLVVVANNQSFFNDEVHQEKVARHRGRPVENKGIGLELTNPPVDVAGLARTLGAVGFGPCRSRAELAEALQQALAAVDEGKVAVIDAHITKGYSPAMAAALRN